MCEASFTVCGENVIDIDGSPPPPNVEGVVASAEFANTAVCTSPSQAVWKASA